MVSGPAGTASRKMVNAHTHATGGGLRAAPHATIPVDPESPFTAIAAGLCRGFIHLTGLPINTFKKRR
jgi:hypothetical protein